MGTLFNQIKESIINRINQVQKFILMGNLYVVIGLVAFMVADEQRRKSEIYQAWQVVSTAHGQKGNGGRIDALEFLNTRPLVFPWVGLTWDKREKQWLLGWRGEQQTLRGLEVPYAHLKSIDLSYANLQQSNLTGADLTEADLKGADFREANLKEANLRGADLKGADLEGTNLAGANLSQANLASAFLWGANLKGVDLSEANLASAFLWGANLRGVDLSEANLVGADLEGAKLSSAILVGANLNEISNLETTVLTGAFYTKRSSFKLCRVFNPTIYLDQGHCDTKFPTSFNPETAGMILIETPEQAKKLMEKS
ncbi:MAG: pentapeptide repeat-containing protein [Xenococcaceae cyanobacterium MO_188.B19]|nr:pentapeptide repeat-containing protein [Xenococcaceae cyanobacterium MO_188.B19]